VGLNLLVLACVASSIPQDLLRDHSLRRCAHFPQNDRPGRPVLFTKGSVQLPKACVTTLSSGYSRLIADGGQFNMIESKDRVRVGPQGWRTLCPDSEALVGDLRNMFGKSGPAAGV
jgi:hypothetical protein